MVQTSSVLYDEESQEKQIDLILKPLEQLDNEIDTQSIQFNEICKAIITDINNLSAKSKNELFKEEQEVRLIHNPKITDDKKNKRFIFEDNLSQMMFRSVCGNLIPYFELKFDEEKQTPAILEIIKGPKNKFIEEEVKIFLSNNGFYCVDIKSSKSSYR
mgnify:FL=1